MKKKKDAKEKKTWKKKRWPEWVFIIMAYWINVGSRGRLV